MMMGLMAGMMMGPSALFMADDLAPILISFSLRVVSDQSLIGSGVANVRRKLPRL